MNYDFDVVVLGGGISGLLIASELSNRYHIAIIEKESLIPHNKYWLTNQKSYDLHPSLQSLIETEYDSMDISAYKEERYKCKGKFYLWNTKKLLKHFTELVNKNKGKIITATKFIDYKYEKNSIKVITDKNVYNTKLIIDCMGHGSPIISKNKLLKEFGYYILYGATLKLKKRIQPIGFCNPIKQKRAKYFEVFPIYSNNTAHAVYISLEKAPMPYKNLKHNFINFIKNTEFNKYLEIPDNFEKSQLGGIIPIGVLKKKALNRIYFFGESCQLNPASTATGFTRMLYKYKELAKELSIHLENNNLDQNSLCNIQIEYLSNFNKNIQLNVFQESLHWDSDDFLKLVKQMHFLDNDFVYNLLFGDLTKKDIFQFKNVLSLLKSKNIILLRNSIKAIIGIN